MAIKVIEATTERDIELDGERLVVFTISGLRFNEQELADQIKRHFDCSVHYTTFSGVKLNYKSREWTLWEKVKFLFE